MQIRQATLSDRPEFLRLWKDFMIEQEKSGSTVEVCDDNLIACLGLFESYIAGSLFGFTLLAMQDDIAIGVLMAGESPPSGFCIRTNQGRMITLWGVYVAPGSRRQGLAHKLQDTARDTARRLGFDTVTSSITASDPVGQANALGWGAKIVEHIITSPLGESEDTQ